MEKNPPRLQVVQSSEDVKPRDMSWLNDAIDYWQVGDSLSIGQYSHSIPHQIIWVMESVIKSMSPVDCYLILNWFFDKMRKDQAGVTPLSVIHCWRCLLPDEPVPESLYNSIDPLKTNNIIILSWDEDYAVCVENYYLRLYHINSEVSDEICDAGGDVGAASECVEGD